MGDAMRITGEVLDGKPVEIKLNLPEDDIKLRLHAIGLGIPLSVPAAIYDAQAPN